MNIPLRRSRLIRWNRATQSEKRSQLSGADSHPEWVAQLPGERLLPAVSAPHGTVFHYIVLFTILFYRQSAFSPVLNDLSPMLQPDLLCRCAGCQLVFHFSLLVCILWKLDTTFHTIISNTHPVVHPRTIYRLLSIPLVIFTFLVSLCVTLLWLSVIFMWLSVIFMWLSVMLLWQMFWYNAHELRWGFRSKCKHSTSQKK